MMSPRKQSKPTRSQADRAARGPAPLDHVRLCLLAAFVAVCVARPLVPCEGVAWLGDGHPFTLLLLIITGGYLLMALQRGRFTRSFGPLDAAVGALVLLCIASSVMGLLGTRYTIGDNSEFDERVASPRLAINMIWEWVGLGLVFFLARQLIVTSFESRAVVTVMIALAVVLSTSGLFQVFVSLPAEQAAYAENPDEVLMRLGEWYPPGSPERARFEDRLNSTEPVATFALANSLAGYLTPWLLVALGVAWSIAGSRAGANSSQPGARRGTMPMARMAGLAVCIAAILICLILSKSRSAYLALAVGLMLLPLADEAFRRVLNWRVIAVAAIVLAVAIGAAVGSGRLDAEVFTEASKSLDYRLEYWQATLDMIANYPFFGVGPGEFQNYYTQFKLPWASEEIRDPHNFLLEVWATAGTLAFLALVTVLAVFAWQSWELSAPAEASPDASADDDSASKSTFGFVAAGAAGGMLVAFGVGPPFGFYLALGELAAGLAIGAGVLAILWPWASGGRLPLRLPALGVFVLAVHLLAAGGFTFPGVGGTFWILMALGLNQQASVDRAKPAAGGKRRLAAAVALGITIGAAVAFYYTAFLPVLTFRAAMIKALDEGLNDEDRFDALTEAAEADPYSAEPWMAIAQLCVKNLKQNPKSDHWGNRFIRAATGVVETQAHSSAAWRAMAGWYREIYQVDPNANLADRVLQLSRGAAYLYPNSAVIQADYALALEVVGKTAAARRTAAKALDLDRLTPHADKKLSPDVKQRIEQLLADAEKP